MTTLIAVYNSEGCMGRCDARCYEAHEPDCDCICGGRNHGAGLQQAIENTRALAESWIEEYNLAHHLVGVSWTIPARKPVQLALL
ncbi:MAG: hypothetical protein DDG60_00780 [Anaerolineae bacterium]|nr:MAG: hypothetical protein DDG60_00780 [Anaerolineae bacterium]